VSDCTPVPGAVGDKASRCCQGDSISFTVHHGDCLDVLRGMADNSVDSIVTDPPYGLSFMGKKWDYDVPSVAIWVECLRVLKPGGHLLAFAGTRTQHRMAARIEDAGFEIRDLIAWVYGSGFPKSLDVSKAIDSLDAAEARTERRYRFTEWFKPVCVLTKAEMDAVCGTADMGRHWTDVRPNGRQPDVPTRQHFEKLRPYIAALVPDWIEEMVDQRTVESENFKRRAIVGAKEMRDTSEVRIAVTANAETYDCGARRFVSLTAASTDAARQWEGWGTALKPALEPITVARKPLIGTVAANVSEHGTGAINVDACRIPGGLLPPNTGNGALPRRHQDEVRAPGFVSQPSELGRWPANLVHDGSDDVLAAFPQAPGQMAKASKSDTQRAGQNAYGAMARGSNGAPPRGDAGSAARFFYCAKASRKDRGGGNKHPTVKPTDLMRYLCRLVTPPGGLVLDPFTGSGSTGKAAVLEGFRFVGVERDADSVATAEQRIAEAAATGPAGADDVLQEPGQEVAADESSTQELEAAEPVPAAASSEPVLREGPRRAKAPKAVAPINQLDMFEASA
jgi:DNA modification methylase